MKLIVDTDAQTIELEGVKFAMACLEVFCRPQPNKFYSFERRDDTVWVKELDMEALRAAVTQQVQ